MERVVVALVLAGVAVAVALLLQRRRVDAPTQPHGTFEAPVQLDRTDFERPEAPWLVGVFTSATCSTCGDVWAKAELLASDEVAVQQLEAVTAEDLHRRYRIEAVPIVAIADREGVVRRSFVGPVSSTHLWAAVAELREPGSVPASCAGHDADEPVGSEPGATTPPR
jgi:hypothetical protein